MNFRRVQNIPRSPWTVAKDPFIMIDGGTMEPNTLVWMPQNEIAI